MKRDLLAVLMSFLAASCLAAPDSYSVMDFGAKGDGKSDDTAAFQKALDAAASAGGGVVHAPRGNYFFTGHLKVPGAVTLKGIGNPCPRTTEFAIQACPSQPMMARRFSSLKVQDKKVEARSLR